MIPPTILAAVVVGGILALVPVARLRAAEWPVSLLGAYWLVLVVLAVALAAGFALRIVAPILLVAWIAPILIVRVRRRRSEVITRR